ncbi:MAG: DSD1 family PLP-dependent enzyme [Betaproteobacteria bacterium]|nr:DSD1 family PLP-dependent enzyme [Betaproteobacteria bacterium]
MSDSAYRDQPSALPPPASVGIPLAEVETPALLLDLDAFEFNLRSLNETLSGRKVKVRPHAKSHKCPEIARRQIAAGAIGICCQKTSEAEAFVRHGVTNILVANEVVGDYKIRRLAQLAKSAAMGVCVDNATNVRALELAMAEVNALLYVLVEVDVGTGRCGVQPGPQAVALARAVAASPHLRFAGIQAYHGAAQHLRSPQERADAIRSACDKVRTCVDGLTAAGLPPQIIAGAGTGTYLHEADSGLYNELQTGSYIFMDTDYGRNLEADGKPVRTFRQSLFILSTVMSRPVGGRAVVDVGLKAHSVDSGMPGVADLEGARYLKASDEHGVLEYTSIEPRLGQKVKLIPGHCDPTVNLYDWLVCYRGDRVEDIWAISARGAFY